MTRRSCPSPAVLRAYERQSLSESEMDVIGAHIQTCGDCVRNQPWSRERRLAIVLGSLCIAALALVPRMPSRRAPNTAPATALQTIANVLPRDARRHEARLSGIPWAPYRGSQRGSGDEPADYRLEAELVRAVAAEYSPDPNAVHTAAVAHLLRDRPGDALATIRRAIDAEPSNGTFRSDAAAMVLTNSLESSHPEELPDALAHADAALRVTPALADALFNRALILERMGLRQHAVAAWRAYLAVDGSSLWADEARAHLQQLDYLTDSQQFRAGLAGAEAAAAGNDFEAVRAFVMRHRQLSRAWCEVEVLGKWAEALRADDSAAAARHLQFARMVGTALEGINGEALLDGAVRAIQDATGPALAALVDAHVTYRQARLLLAGHNPASAEPLFAMATAKFVDGGSPLSGSARFYGAMAVYELQRTSEAKERLLQIPVTPSYRALEGYTQWQLGMCHYALGDWSASLAAYQRAASAFQDLGESANEGFARVLIADLYDTVGDREHAWVERIDGFRALSDAGRDDRLHVSISGAARAELQSGRTETAASLLAVASEEAKIATAPETAILSYASLALLRAGARDSRGAAVALQEANAAAEKMSAAVAPRTKAAVQVAEAAIVLETEPERALTLLRKAEEHYTRTNRRAWLPGVHLQQGRALRRLGRDDEALRRLTAGVRELERQRSSVSDADLRATVFDGAGSLFSETIDLLIRRRAYGDAFDMAERFRARTLFEELATRTGTAPMREAGFANSRPKLGPDVAVLEYVVLEDRTIGFSIRGGDMQTFVVDVSRERLRAMVAALVEAIRTRRDVGRIHAVAGELHQVLIAPAARAVTGAATLVFVPDRFLQQVPFSSLYDPDAGRYLMQDYAIAVAPSLRLLDRLARAKRPAASLDALVIGNPFTGGELVSLPASETEARAIAGMYGRSSLLLRRDATRERFDRDWSRAKVVHYGGHATTSASRGAAASLALAAERRADHMAAHEIAQLEGAATRLVVLAACDSFGRGKEHLETTPTLAHAFLAAGVPSVVGALWPINDEPSRELFRTFHRHWTASDGGVAASLRHAQLALLDSSDPALRHPASWAGVAVLGDPFQHYSNLQESEP